MDSIYKFAIIIMILCGTWIILVRSMKINYEDEYADIGHASFAVEDGDLGSNTQGAAVGAGVVGAGTLAMLAAFCLPG